MWRSLGLTPQPTSCIVVLRQRRLLHTLFGWQTYRREDERGDWGGRRMRPPRRAHTPDWHREKGGDQVNYWLTTQWPPLEGRNYAAPFSSDDDKPYVWLRHGDYERVGKPLDEGDLVVVYEVEHGPTEVRLRNVPVPFACKHGQTAIVFHGRVASGFKRRPDGGLQSVVYFCKQWHPEKEREMWWEWRAPLEILRHGRVPCREVKVAMPDFSPKGWGGKTGLKKDHKGTI